MAFLIMELRIGATLDGRAIRFDTRDLRPLLLVGDAGTGKTTTARFLTRWWLADTDRHAHVYAHRLDEWDDLNTAYEHPPRQHQLDGNGCRRGRCLVVMDLLDLMDLGSVTAVRSGSVSTILTSSGGHALDTDLLPTNPLCLGLMRPSRPAHPDALETAVRHGQARMDWPDGTIAVLPDQRGTMDFPHHRWEMTSGRRRFAPRRPKTTAVAR